MYMPLKDIPSIDIILCAPMWASASTEFYCVFINVGGGALDAPLYALSFFAGRRGAGPYRSILQKENPRSTDRGFVM